MPVAKTITYENLTEEQKKDPNILPFRYKKPFLQELEEMEQQKDETRNGGIMQVASARGDRKYLIMALSRYYTPRDLYYKTTKDLNRMLEMYINVHGGLI